MTAGSPRSGAARHGGAARPAPHRPGSGECDRRRHHRARSARPRCREGASPDPCAGIAGACEWIGRRRRKQGPSGSRSRIQARYGDVFPESAASRQHLRQRTRTPRCRSLAASPALLRLVGWRPTIRPDSVRWLVIETSSDSAASPMPVKVMPGRGPYLRVARRASGPPCRTCRRASGRGMMFFAGRHRAHGACRARPCYRHRSARDTAQRPSTSSSTAPLLPPCPPCTDKLMCG